MRLLINLLLITGILAGGLYYFFRDTPFVVALFPQFKVADEGESVHSIYIRRLEHALKEGQRTDYAALADYYLEAANQKYAAMAKSEDAVSRQRYLQAKQQEYNHYVRTIYDGDNSGALERGEWPDDLVFRFIIMDADKNNILTYEEIWVGAINDSSRAFATMDRDGSGSLSKEEYIAGVNNKEVVQRTIRSTDINSNGDINLDEVKGEQYRGKRRWQP